MALAGRAVDDVRRADSYHGYHAGKSKTSAGRFVKGARWSLLKAPERQSTWQLAALHEISKTNRRLYRGFLLKEQLRLLYHLDDPAAADLDAWLAWASRSKLKPFVKLARTLRARRDGVLAAIRVASPTVAWKASTTRCACSATAALAFAGPPRSSPSTSCCTGLTPRLPLR